MNGWLHRWGVGKTRSMLISGHYSLVTLCQPLHARPVDAITTEDVLNVLTAAVAESARDGLTAQRAD